MGIHRLGLPLRLAGPSGWTVRTNQTRLVGWSFTGGVAYNPTTYHPEDAPDLIAVGSNWNGLVRLGLTLANDSRVSLGLGLSHTSNGALRRPNKGINTPHARLIVRPTAVPNRRVFADGAQMGAWSHVLGLGIGGRDQDRTEATFSACRNCLRNPPRVVAALGLTAQWRCAPRRAAGPKYQGLGHLGDVGGGPLAARLERGVDVAVWPGAAGLLKGGSWTTRRLGSKRYNGPNLDGRAPSLDVFASLRFRTGGPTTCLQALPFGGGALKKSAFRPRWDM